MRKCSRQGFRIESPVNAVDHVTLHSISYHSARSFSMHEMRLTMLQRLLAFGILFVHLAPVKGIEPQVQQVVLVSVDGLSASYLDDEQASP